MKKKSVVTALVMLVCVLGPQGFAEMQDLEAVPDAAEAADLEVVPDAAEAADLEAVLDAAKTVDLEAVPDITEAADFKDVPETAEIQDLELAPDTVAGAGLEDVSDMTGEKGFEAASDIGGVLPYKPLSDGKKDTETPAAALLDQWPGYFPRRWYAGDYGKKPVVRSQGEYGTCWALSAVSAMEAVLLPEKHLVFSADHMSLNNAFTMDVNVGGDCEMTMAYLSGWQGPVLEEEDPYGDGYSPEGLLPAVHVQEIQVCREADRDWIKKMVRRYGAVQTSLFMSRKTTASDERYYNEKSASYYYPVKQEKNHDVVILGWDDSYSRFNFLQVPDEDGAYICQNAWGSDFGEDGIFYVSYEDANIGSVNVVYSRIEAKDNYARIYQTDDCGWQAVQGFGNETCWFANVYTAEAQERLAAVGFYATAPDAYYEVYLVRDFAGPQSFGEGEFLQGGALQNEGYYTVDLDQAGTLAEGERFAVAVKLVTPGRDNPVAVEYQADQYTMNVTTEGKEGYLSPNGRIWQNTEERYGTNVCLKVYTK